ncbi:SMP-30/gluconolactonase/LRE family protein [Algoriphagus aestuariicola]|uniref:SMP-30/gluconolactonase/LRE family protein n=1 Tax=Algoriphagus aestuariicola TaxID=1852016 RepID=A0ABS3BWP9_9BACT|nr:SMP-30/gluconolactonase/LRE family protein [Algoriphagus aestuariicola]MBN7803281.1 SMP-30/gluconolactonase/LRE family protein [Algoriphagus aestuariicola]
MKKSCWFAILVLAACSSPKIQQEAVSKFNTIGSVERLDSAINALIPADAQIEVLASGFEWAEGPLWLEDQQALIFTDVPANKIWKWTEKDSLSLYLSPSGYLGDRMDKHEPGANGLALDSSGNLILCQHGERQVGKMLASLDAPKSEFEALATGYEGKRFNSPNDLVFNSSGQLFFTDPPYGMDPWDEKQLDFQGVYRLDQDGKVSLLVDSLSRPNGIALSPDQKTLYIAQSDPEKARYYAFGLDESGNVISGKVLFDASPLQSESRKGLPDGLKVHSSGTLFATGPGGVLVISPEGKLLGTIMTENGTANCGFDIGEKYLYMTADAYLMRIALK